MDKNRKKYRYISDLDFARLKSSPQALKTLDEHGEEEVQNDIERLTLPTNVGLSMQQAVRGQTIRVMLLGKTGNGKSATANSLFSTQRNNKFEVAAGPNSGTKEIQTAKTKIEGVNFEIMDTPGLLDTSVSQKKTMEAISRVVSLWPEGPHAILYALNASERLTREEYLVFEFIKEKFGEGLEAHTVLVLTHGDDIIRNDRSLQDYCNDIENRNDHMSKFFELLGNRIVAVDNSSTVPCMRERTQTAICALVMQTSRAGAVSYQNVLHTTALQNMVHGLQATMSAVKNKLYPIWQQGQQNFTGCILL